MGVGHITDARETAGGTVQAGGLSANVVSGTGGFDPLKANVDPFKARKIQLENLKPVAEAMRKHELATKGIEKASATRADIDEIRNGNPNGDGNGNYVGMWRDRNGVWNLPLNSDQLTAEGRDEMTRRAQEEIRHRRDQRLAGETNDIRAFVNRETGEDIAAFEGDCEEALLVGRIGENFARAEASVAGDAGAMTNTALGRIGSDNAQLKTLKAVGGDEFDAVAAARQRTNLWARQYVRQSLEGRMKAAVVLASQSGGLMSPAKAMERVNAIYDGQASELMRKLVEAGEYDRARTFVGHAEELGYSGAVKAKALEDIDRAEISLATANGLKAYGTVWNESGELIRGRDKILDAQIATLKRVAENAPKGSRTAIAALQQAGRFEEAADSIAYGDLLDGIANGIFHEATKDGTAKLAKQPFEKGTRAARLWPKAVEACNAKVSAAKTKAMKQANEVEGAEIAKAIATRDPQSYYRWLTERCKDGAYSTGDYKVHEAKFKNTWMSSSQPELISEMAAIVDSTFGVEFSKWLAVDKNGNKAVNPLTGQSVLAKDAVLPDIPYTVVPSAEVAQLPWWSKFGMDSATAAKSPYQTTLSGADMKEIMDSFLRTWMHNGKDVSEEQLRKDKYVVGGVEFDLSFLYDDEADGKADKASGRKSGYHRIDAVRDFKRICDRINLGKRSLEMWKNRSDPSLLKKAEKSAMRPTEIKAMGTLKTPYAGW